MDEAEEFDLRLIEPGDKLTGLSTGAAEFLALKTFVQRHAKEYHRQNLARTYGVFVQGGKLVGYMTLVCGQVETKGAGEVAANYSYGHFPAIKIARLLIDSRYRGKKLGEQLVDFAVGTAKDVICPAVGCRFVVVDAKQASIKFYEKCGFTILDTPENRARPAPVMFLDLHKAAPKIALPDAANSPSTDETPEPLAQRA